MSQSHTHRGLTVGVLFAAIAQVLWPASAAAQSLPTGQFAETNASVSTSGTTMTVTVSAPRAFVNWNTFDVANGYTFQANGAGNFLLVNRVVGGQTTNIDGLVQSTGNVWILNDSGFAVGSTGRFNVGSLLLTTRGLTDADILDGNTSFTFTGQSTSAPVSLAAGSELRANSGGIFLLAERINSSGGLIAAGTNGLFASREMTVTFDANLAAVTTVDLGAGTSETNGIVVGNGAAFTGSRNLLMAAGMTSGQGNVLLSNPGGANDIRFNGGAVELISRDANVTAQGAFTTPGDLTVEAALMFQGNGGPTVGGNYSIQAQDFSGGVFNPVFVGTTNSLTIIDTQFGLTIGNLAAPGDINVSTIGGDLSVNGIFGSPTSTSGNINLSSSNGLNLAGNLTTSAPGRSVNLTAGTSINQTSGVISTGTLNAVAQQGISLTGSNAWSAASFGNFDSGNVVANSVNAWTLLGANSAGTLALTGPSITVAGNAVSAGNMTLDADLLINGNTLLQSTGGTVLLDGSVDGGGATSNLTVTSSGGATIAGNVGANTALSLLRVNGAATFNGSSARTTGVIDLDGTTVSGTGFFTFNAGGAFTAQSVTAPSAGVRVDANGIVVGSATAGDVDSGVFRSVLFNAGTGGVQLGSGSAASFEFNGAGNLTVTGALDTVRLTGALGGSATLNGNNTINSIGAFSSAGLSLRDLNSLVIDGLVDAGAGDVRIEVVNETLQIDGTGTVRGDDIALSSNAFFNASGSDALAATGHWVVYQTTLNPFAAYDNLDSGQTALWGQTINSLAPASISGNRYVFSFTPTLTFTSTNTTKTYGTDLAGAAGSFFAVSGYRPGVAGAYLGDTAATAFGGAPAITSAGFATRAPVAGGPFAITIANGSLTSLNGYAFAFNSAGAVTVNPLALTGTPTVATKTYDGTNGATGSIGLAGVVAGDTVAATGNFSFVDKNAGLGKTVNLTGAALTGADAGNYTLTVPATALGDILQRAISGTGSVTTKTYDGNATGSGTITLSGVLAGDDLGATGTFAFVDKNAGLGKSVTLSNVTLTGVDAGNYTLTVPASLLGDILQRAITGTVTVNTKTYDGSAAGAGSVALAGVVAGDEVAGSATFTFNSDDAGNGKTVTVSGAALSGVDAANYTVTLPASALGDILRKVLTGTPVVATKTYDGNTSASGTIGLTGVVAGDAVSASGTFAFADKNAGIGKSVTVSGTSLGGADAGNYTLSVPATVLGDILQKAIAGNAVTSTKVYDGSVAGSGTITLSDVVAGDDLGATATFTFADKNAGSGKSVTVSAVALSGADAGNYVVNVPSSAIGEILRRAITGTVTVDTRAYDGSTTATGGVALSGTVAGDSVAAITTLAFADRNAGAGKLVNVSGTALTGADAGNYTLTAPTTATGTIVPRALDGTAMVTTKTYDGSTAGSGSISLAGVVAGDSVAASGTFAYADKNAGLGKLVTVSGVTLSGVDAANYTINVPAAAVGDILRRSITGTATVGNKTYDGTATGVGTIALAGVVAGDSVGATGTFTFSDANAGAGKSVAVGGVAVTGADAGNYSVVVTGSTVADILRRAITVTANPASKPEGSSDPALTYGVTQGSLVAGDSLTGALARVSGEAPGVYSIGQGTLAATANYQLTFVGSTLTITEVVVDPTAGVTLNDGLAGVVRFLDDAVAEGDAQADSTLDIRDERRACDPSGTGDSPCEPGAPR